MRFMQEHVGEWLSNAKLRKISGMNDTPRTIRGLRQEGWNIEVRGDAYSRLTSLDKGEAKGSRFHITQKTRYLVLHRDGYRCRACGRETSDGVKLEIDHVIPIAWGGTNEPDNLQALCQECNHGKQAWVAEAPAQQMKEIFSKDTVESRIEALFDMYPNEDVPSTMIQLVSKGALDWQRALRKIRQRTGKKILPLPDRRGYRYHKD